VVETDGLLVTLEDDLRTFASLVIEVGPTVREFTDARGYSSTSVAEYHLDKLREAGLIARRIRNVDGGAGGARVYVLTDLGRAALQQEAMAS
jgi:DNA-binding MarR family transcriptional regulator